jgi:cytochrome c oxidase assembly factor CtaG
MVCLLVVGLLIALTSPAHAYVDAGSGSYMIQMSLASVLAVVFSVKLAWQRFRASAIELFSRERKESPGAV